MQVPHCLSGRMVAQQPNCLRVKLCSKAIEYYTIIFLLLLGLVFLVFNPIIHNAFIFTKFSGFFFFVICCELSSRNLLIMGVYSTSLKLLSVLYDEREWWQQLPQPPVISMKQYYQCETVFSFAQISGTFEKSDLYYYGLFLGFIQVQYVQLSSFCWCSLEFALSQALSQALQRMLFIFQWNGNRCRWMECNSWILLFS